MKYEIEFQAIIKDKVEYEPVEYREPDPNDWFLTDQGIVAKAQTNFKGYPRIILQPKYSWPVWLKGWGFAMNTTGTINWYEYEPCQNVDGRWSPVSGYTTRVIDLQRYIEFTPPVITDWTKPVLNPNYLKQS